MDRSTVRGRWWARVAGGLAAAGLVAILLGTGAPAHADGAADANPEPPAPRANADAAGAGAGPEVGLTVESVLRRAEVAGHRAVAWYRQTPPVERVTYGGLGACAGLGLLVLLERMWATRRRRVTPPDFLKRFRERLTDGRFDRGKALDLCELNPSPAGRVALAAVRRWGRPVVDVERAVALASRVEIDRLKRNVGTLRRLAALAPLLGLLGTLIAAGRGLATPDAAWGPTLGAALMPLTAGVALAVLALVAYDGLVARVEKLSTTIDRLGAETVDAVALATPVEAPAPASASASASGPRLGEARRGPHIAIRPNQGHGSMHAHSPHHPLRVEIPEAMTRDLDRDDRYDD